MKIIRSREVDYASLIMLAAMLYGALVAPNGASPSCQELWCIILVKALFATLAYAFLESAFFFGAPLQRLTCRFLFGKKVYEDYDKEIREISNT